MSSCIDLKKYLFISITIILSFIYSPVYATNDVMLDLLKILVDKGSLTQGEYELLVSAAGADSEKDEEVKIEAIKHEAREVAKETAKEEVAEASKSMPKITTKEKPCFF